MSYCRWSSDFGECDVYVYEDASGGWTTHVAGRRLIPKVPQEIRDIEDLFERGQAERAWRETLPGDDVPDISWWVNDDQYEDLDSIGPEAGQSYNDDTPGECAARLRTLKFKGFNVPDYAIEALEREERDR